MTLNQDEELTRRVQETDSQNTSQEETQPPVEEEECRKNGDQDETRSVEKHQETGSPNQDREVPESSDETHREKPDSAKEAELEPKTDYRVQGILHESVEQEDEARRKFVSHLVHVVQTNPYKESLDRGLATTKSLQPIM